MHTQPRYVTSAQGALPSARKAAGQLVAGRMLVLRKNQRKYRDGARFQEIHMRYKQLFLSRVGRGENGKAAIVNTNIPGAGEGHNRKNKPVADAATLVEYQQF